jgi:hypothetical protein
MALGFEPVYGVPPAPGQFWRMPFVGSGLGAEQPLIASDLLGYGRDPLAPVRDAVTAEGDIVVPIDARFLGIWLTALFGPPVTTAVGDDFSHEFRSGAWTLPSFSAEIGMPDLPWYGLNTGCVANSIAWTMNRSGLITATVNVIAQGETTASVSAVGAPAEMALRRFGAFNGAVRRNGTRLGNITSAEVTYANNLDRIETIRDDGKIDGADPSVAALSGTINVRFADTTLIDQAVAGEPCELEFSYALDAGPRFSLVAHAVYLPKPKVSLEGPAGVQASFAWQAASAAAVMPEAPARMATVTLVNDLASYAIP